MFLPSGAGWGCLEWPQLASPGAGLVCLGESWGGPLRGLQPLRTHPVAVAGSARVLRRVGGAAGRSCPSVTLFLQLSGSQGVGAGVWRNGRGRQRRLPSSLACAHSVCRPGLAPQASEPGTGHGQQMTERVLCALSPGVQAAAHTGLAVGTWLQEEVLVPIRVAGDFGAFPPKASQRVLPWDV